MGRFFGVAVAVVMGLAPSLAAAQAEPVTEVEALAQTLDEELDALDTSDCDVACRALESMIRSADRICELDPGPPCEAARDKVEVARKKVRAACPDCAVATDAPANVPPPKPGSRDLRPHSGKTGEGATVPDSPAPAPPALKSRDGGCAACTVGPAGGPAGGWIALAGAALWMARRRRR